jgi:predicted Fe-S protein YdhL (DUF1289 family)
MARKDRTFHEEDETEQPVSLCWLCARTMGEIVEWHHPIPKSRGGRERQQIHPICHQTIHANFTNSELERRYSSAEALLEHPEIRRFVDWVAGKHPDFNAPTKERR